MDKNEKVIRGAIAAIAVGISGAMLWAFSYAGMIKMPSSSGGNSKQISESTWGADYPFTVDGELICLEPNTIIFKAGGVNYAVNGTAMARGYAELRPVWKDDPAMPGTKFSLGQVIAEAQKLCK